MIVDDAIYDAVEGLKNVRWRETAFADLQWYYAEEGVYVLRCKKGDPNEYLCVIRAKSADEAISRAVFNLYKADEKKKSAPVGDMAAMRKTLEAIISGYENADLCDKNYGEWCHDSANVCVNVPLCKAIHEARAALSKPARNCEVGTAEEQAKRFKTFCDSHYNKMDGICGDCPAKYYIDGWGVPYCQIKWAQMPYEEGNAK